MCKAWGSIPQHYKKEKKNIRREILKFLESNEN
jgi:hypothetical protein